MSFFLFFFFTVGWFGKRRGSGKGEGEGEGEGEGKGEGEGCWGLGDDA